ncbi:MAG TPA: ABC transporter substrate-binding protein [Trueperaceae bacterium]|nr:ABC transporter substrate-binding protein [Trueperaceae bacterium]
MPRKTFTTLLLALTLVAGGAAFAQPKVVDYPGLGMTPGNVGGTITLGLADSPPTFLYYAQIDNNTQTLTGVVFDSLVEFNLETYAIEPGLAASWDVSPDGTVYTFHLRQGVTWHDGTPFTAADVIFTYTQIIANPEARAGDAAAFVFTVDGEQRPVTFDAPDDATVVMTLPAPAAAFLLQQRFPIMPKHKLVKFSVEGGAAQADINNGWATDTPLSEIVGTGPFMYDTYVAGQKVGLVRNPNYWKVDAAGTSLPYAERLDYLVVRGNEAQAAQFLAGNLATLNISGAQFPDFKSREVAGADFRVVTSPALFGSPPLIAFNFADSQFAAEFSNVAFRRAMEQAVDRQRIIDDVYNGLAEIPGTPTAPADGTFYEDTKSLMLPFDLTAAAAALDALGIKDTNNNGVRNVPSGAELEFSLTYNSDSSTFTDMATILQNDFAKIGVKANLVGVQGSALLSTGLAGDYQAIIIALGNQPDPELRKPIWQPGGSLYYWHRSTQPAVPGGPANFAAMADWEKRIYDIFDQGTTLVDRDARIALYKEWQRINAEMVPVIMIAKPANIAAVHASIGNYVYNLGVIPGYNPVPLYFVE